jgi:hypothetical protein
MSERRRRKCRAMDAEENQRQVSLRAPPPLGIADGAIPTFPPPRRGRGKVESQRQASHFPTVRFVISNSKQKGGPAAGRFATASKLILH